MNSESVSTVFDVTSSSGATKSLKTADRNLKQQSESDITYYNTYLKRYPLLYENEIGLTTKMVNLRECALTFMMDNLVRLKYHRDPDPGEHRSMQICTLPITIKGLPLDSTIIKLWHNPSCPGDENVSECNCMKDEHTPAETIQHNILTMNDDEECWLKRFRQLSSLGHKDVWAKILEEHLHMIERSANDGTDDLLEASFLSLNLDDTEEYDVTQWATQNESDESDNEMIDELDENYDMQSIQLDSVILDPTFDMPEFSSEWSFINESFEDKASSHFEGVFDFESLNTSLDELTSTSEAEVPLSDSLGFHKYTPPPLFTRHPPPAVGRDDDLDKLQEILDDVLIKTDNNKSTSHKILFGADQKISSNLFKLQEIDKKYDIFLPEFPLLHLRKSKITILCSAYKEAGILHILKYMRDEDFNEWKKLIAADHIEMATTYIKRLTISLSIAFFSVFMQSMPESSRSEIESDFTPAKVFENHWEEFVNFLEEGRRRNGTFALHLDILQHCEEVCAISLAERLGGKVGYTLLLAAVKSSLPFSFLNGASSYAAFSTKLLYTHLKCGEYYKNMKFCLFTTPHKGSDTNFALDTQREMDHRDALKAFRSGSTATSILPRMSLVDSLNELQEPKNTNAVKPDDELLGLKTTQTDKKYICRMVELILRQGGISTVEDERVFNVYDLHRPILSDVILDSKTYGIGRYLMKKFLSQTYSIITTKLPDVEEIKGPTHLLKKLKSFKGVTLKRMGLQSKTIQKNTRIEKESIRKKVVQKETQRIDCLTSEMNACQAVVKPDCSKPAVKKSFGIKQGLYNLLTSCIQKLEGLPIHLPSKILEEKGLVYESVRSLPRPCSETVTMATVEFAGVKFKSFSSSGNQYLKFVQNAIILKSLQHFPNLRQMAICEEKYQFTPDDFKAATRSQRTKTTSLATSHLKTPSEILSSERFDKTAIVTTAEGKKLISTYLAKNLKSIQIPKDFTLDVDSECLTKSCRNIDGYSERYTTPIQAVFTCNNKTPRIEELDHIRQNKGEAEMAQIDWLIEYSGVAAVNESFVSIVTSGDIDSVVLHLFALAYLWPRNESTGDFKNEVFVMLQKPGKVYDVFNVTAILIVFERVWKDKYIGQKIALALCLGGNDYLPKFYGISHNFTLEVFVSQQYFLEDLFQFYWEDEKLKVTVNTKTYTDFIKALYCPKSVSFKPFTFDEVRQMSIQSYKGKSTETKNPKIWMPPESVIKRLGKNVQCLANYYLTLGHHDSKMPNFLMEGCLTKTEEGDIQYDFGPDSKVTNIEECCLFRWDYLQEKLRSNRNIDGSSRASKRKLQQTPQKGRRRKIKPYTSTPRKHKDESNDNQVSQQQDSPVFMDLP